MKVWPNVNVIYINKSMWEVWFSKSKYLCSDSKEDIEPHKIFLTLF